MMTISNNRIDTLLFEESPVRAIVSGDETIVWLCLNDLTKILDRTIMVENGQAMKLCKSAFRIPFKVGGRNRWGVKPYDVHNLLRPIRTENGRIAQVCDRLQSWINGLPVRMEPDQKVTLVVPTKEPVIFNYRDQFPITFKAENGKTMVNATQMARS